MRKVYLFSLLLIFGVVLSQVMAFDGKTKTIELIINSVTLICLAFIMIHVGLEFSIDRSRLKSYGWDYYVAFMAATLPWIFCAIYFIYFFNHQSQITDFNLWLEALVLGRFAAPTSAGILFAMLAAADLEKTWVYKKARILAIFDDLNTIILLIPIQMLMVGFKWESLLLLSIIGSLIYLVWKKLHSYFLPIQWYSILIYSVIIVVLCETIYLFTTYLKDVASLQIEVLLPAFVLGCILAYSKEELYSLLSLRSEKIARFLITASFMFFVGMSMPAIGEVINSESSSLSIEEVILHVVAITLLSNLGKMLPLFCYRKEASVKERLAVSLGMCLRGEIGVGKIFISVVLIKYIDQSLIFIAMLSLIVNLILTGPIIIVIKKLLSKDKSDTALV